MRRKDEEKANGNGAGHIKFRVIEFEIDGGNNTLAEGIKALTTALQKSPVVLTPGTRPSLPAASKPTSTTSATVVEDDAEAAAPQEETETVEPPAAEGNGSSPAKVRRAVPRTPEILNDIDFNTGTVTLKDFVAQKNPADSYEKYAVISTWYKENHALAEVTPDRIYTAYKFLGWVPPNDVAQPLRDLKSSKKWFDKGARGAYKINIIGLNKVAEGFKKN